MSKSEKRGKSKQGPQDLTMRMLKRIENLERVIMEMAEQINAMSPIVQQMIVIMVLLQEKGLITDGEIANKQRELMQPAQPGFHDLTGKVEGRAGEVGPGSGEAVEGKSEAATEIGTADPDGEIDAGVLDRREVQPENAGSVEGNGGHQELRLSPNPSEGSDQSSSDSPSNGKPDGSADVPGTTDSGIKTADLGTD